MEQPIDSSLDLPLLLPSQDLSYLLTSNDVPLDSDIPVLRRIISDGQNTLDALEVLIQILQSTLARLAAVDAWDAQIHSVLVSLHATIAPLVRDATARSIREYESRCFASSPSRAAGVDLRDIRASALERMRRTSWRRAALSYPRLWPSITFPSLGTCERSAMMETQLSRSGNTLLDILWEGGKFVESRLLDSVAAHSSRWRVLRLHSRQPRPLFGDNESAFDWLRHIGGRLPQLERLELVTTSKTLLVADVFAAAPALHEVVLTDQEFEVASPERIKVPWAQITHYRGCYPLSHQLNILQRAPNLVECAIGYSPFSFDALGH
ncbi:hypothetical protein C8R45DRAFT_1097377 [Mycena sanguinolenta]|nr:hypothetical protein C8R45DRAFT_1097377 [Mycena sanguinolenta]